MPDGLNNHQILNEFNEFKNDYGGEIHTKKVNREKCNNLSLVWIFDS